MISEHLAKNNLHHAYLIEGSKEDIVPEILAFCESIKVKTSGNPDFYHATIDSFKIDEAFEVRAMSTDKGISSSKKIFLLAVNSLTLDAQNVLLKMFEEPIENTHFFLVTPDINSLLKTLISRFYVIKVPIESGNAEKFINMPLLSRINFIKELLAEPEEEDLILDSARTKALKFLNALESTLYRNSMSKMPLEVSYFDHIFKVRQTLRMPGSATKTLLESLALVIPRM